MKNLKMTSLGKRQMVGKRYDTMGDCRVSLSPGSNPIRRNVILKIQKALL